METTTTQTYLHHIQQRAAVSYPFAYLVNKESRLSILCASASLRIRICMYSISSIVLPIYRIQPIAGIPPASHTANRHACQPTKITSAIQRSILAKRPLNGLCLRMTWLSISTFVLCAQRRRTCLVIQLTEKLVESRSIQFQSFVSRIIEPCPNLATNNTCCRTTNDR